VGVREKLWYYCPRPIRQGIRRLNDYRKPRWWKRSVRSYWLILVLLPFVLILAVLGALFLQGATTLTELLKYAVVTSVMIGTAYYIRKINSLKVWRAIWILLGACGICMLVLVVLLGVFGKTLVLVFGPGARAPALLLSFGIAIPVGALLGDYIGKRRDYRPLA
jgi:hypothetical protein